MKKLLCTLLALTLLFSLMAPISAAVSERLPDLSVEMDATQAVEVSEERLLEISTPKRSVTEDNYVFPGPLITKGSFTPRGIYDLPLGVICTGKPNQYMVLQVYAGDTMDGEPVATDYAPFNMAVGYGTYELTWDARGLATGRYTVVTFTAEPEGNNLIGIEGTAFMTDVYVHDTIQSRWDSFVMLPDTWKPLETIELQYGVTTVLAAGRSPLPSYGAESRVSLGSPMFKTESAGGYFFVTPTYLGGGKSTFYYGSGMEHVPVEVCVYADGHEYFDTTVNAGDPTEYEAGYTLKICSGCYSVTRFSTPSYNDNFNAFKDVPSDSWFYGSVEKAVGRNLFNGINTTTFGPNRAMTRAMLVTVLWRYEGEPEAAQASFVDVRSKDWFAGAVNWAAEQEIVNGVGNGKFNPNGTITREQLATILYRYALKKGLDTEATGKPEEFPDFGDLSSWATDAMAWALGRELITGVGKGGKVYLTPKGDATRAQVATILVRFIENLIEVDVYPNTESALDSGTIATYTEGKEITWAFYESGLLQLGGEGDILNKSPDAIPWNVYKDRITSIEFLYGTNIVGNVFEGYPVLETVVMADSVALIGPNAFANCPKLENITFSSTLASIGEGAFKNCPSIREISIPDTSTVNIGKYAFADNVSLESVYLGNNTRQIGDYAFTGCTSLVDLYLPESLLDFEGIYVGQYYLAIGHYAFSGCTSLESCVLPVGMRFLAVGTFSGCTSLREVTLPVALENMFYENFRNCTSLESLYFYPALRRMGTGSFMGCTALKELYFDNIILSIDKENFAPSTTEDSLPFGDPEQVVVYAYPYTGILEKAESYGHKTVDLSQE